MFGQRKVKIPFGQRYRTSNLILRESLRVVRSERRFWVFPLASLVLMMLNTALYAWITFTFVDVASSPWVMLLLLPLLYPAMLAATVCQSALTYGYYQRLTGRPCTPGKAFARAWSRLPTLAMYGLIAMLVSGVLSFVGILLEKLRLVPYLGQVANIAGAFAWAVASFFVIPVIVVQRDVTAVGALRESVSLARQQWGKSVGGMVTIMLALIIPVVVLAFALTFLLFGLALAVPDALGESAMFFLPFVIMVPLFLITALVGMTATQAYQTALYRFAKTGLITAPFTQRTLVDAWAPYQQR